MTCINKEYSDSGLGTQETQVTIVGMEFVAGPEGNVAIAEACGCTVMEFPTGEQYTAAGGYMMAKLPDYCSDAALCIEMLNDRDIVPFILPTEKPNGAKKFEPGFIAVFEIAGQLHTTVPQTTEDAAAACALWFALGISHD